MLLKVFQESLSVLQTRTKDLTYLSYRSFARNVRKSSISKPIIPKKEESAEESAADEFESEEDFEAMKSASESKEKTLKDKLLESDDAKFAEIQNLIKSQERGEIIDFEEKERDEKETIKFIQKQLLYKGHDPFPEKLVQRPDKDAVWGLGGELLQRRNEFFEKGKMPSVDDIILYLEAQQIKDVELFDFEELGRYDLAKYGIIGSGFSSRHIYKVANSLLKSIRDLKIPKVRLRNTKVGARDDEWILVDLPDIAVHLLTQEARPEVDLEHSWTNPISEEEVYQREVFMKKLKKRGEDSKPKTNYF